MLLPKKKICMKKAKAFTAKLKEQGAKEWKNTK